MTKQPNIFTATEFPAALDQATARYQKIALLVGRPGSGKSALLRTISQQMGISRNECAEPNWQNSIATN